MNFNFFMPTHIHFGDQSLLALRETLQKRGYQKVGIVFDHNLTGHALLQEFRDGLKHDMKVVEAAVTVAEPTYAFLDQYRTHFMESEIEAVVGVGGGSTLDTAKAIAVLIHNRRPAITYRGFDKMTEPVLPIYAVPTTAGTGSEITPNASFVDDVANKKLGINGEAVRPRGAYLHPGFIMTCPQKPATYAAIDALIHAIEAFAAKKATPVAKMFARAAVELLVNNMVNAIKHREAVAVANIFWGSLLAAVAMMHSGTGPTAALSYPFGVHCRVPHGLAGAFFLLRVMQWNIAKGYHGYGELLPTRQTAGAEAERLSREFVKTLTNIWKVLGVPFKTGAVGFQQNLVSIFLADLKELRGAIDQNPVSIDENDLKELLLASL